MTRLRANAPTRAESASPPSAPREPASPSRRSLLVTATLAALLSIVLHVSIAEWLDGRAAFDQLDLFFNADVGARMDCMIDGECAGRASVSHPNLALSVNPPVQLAAWVAAGGSGTESRTRWLRHRAAIWVSPLAAGVQTACLVLFAVALGASLLQACAIALLGAVSSSSLVYGSIPESFALSSAAIGLAYLLAARARREPRLGFAGWLVLSVFATGITVTNVVPIAILYVTARREAGEGIRRTALQAGALGGATLAATIAIGLGTASLYESRALDATALHRYVTKWSQDLDPVQRALHFPSALANGIAAPEPRRVGSYQASIHDDRYKFQLTLLGTPHAFSAERPTAWLALALMVAGATLLLRGPPTHRRVAIASLTILFANGLLHSFWGVEHFLYAEHWQPSVLVLCGGVLFAARRYAVTSAVLLLGCAAWVGHQNLQTARTIAGYFQEVAG